MCEGRVRTLQLDAAFSKARDDVDKALRDSIDTERAMAAIKELIGAANMYMKERRDVSAIVPRKTSSSPRSSLHVVD